MKDLVICEGHEILDSYHKLHLGEIKLMQICLGKIFQKEAIDEDTYYEVDLQEYADWFNLDKHSAYQIMEQSARSLMTRTLTLKTSLLNPEAKASSKTIIHWVHSAIYDPETSKVLIKWHRDIIPFICIFGESKLYSGYNLQNTKQMKSVHSIRLYRILNKWKVARKVRLPIAEFKRLMGYSPEEYTRFNNLRDKVIEPALRDINMLSDLVVNVNYDSQGNKKTHIKFSIKTKEIGLLDEQDQLQPPNLA